MEQIKNKIQSLWIGDSLSPIEILSINSFIKNQYQFDLYCYDPISNVPAGVNLKDANEIIPREEVFIAHNSYAIFADYFRSLLLYHNGGTWVDTDVVCLRRFDFDENEVIIGYQEEGEVVCNAVLGFPARSILGQKILQRCEKPWVYGRPEEIEAFEQLNGVSTMELLEKEGEKYLMRYFHVNSPWGAIAGPIGVTTIIKDLNFADKVKPSTYFYPVSYQQWWSLFYDNSIDHIVDFSNSYAVHLWRECVRGYSYFNKSAFQHGSFTQKLWRQYCE
ncbi:MAG: hypothetical protein KA713_05050 [Chryseotalea sp. WA131a]|nr:MAG: hypothetical protein KA713_05050 [Chryseotalea sp. WA131a]